MAHSCTSFDHWLRSKFQDQHAWMCRVIKGTVEKDEKPRMQHQSWQRHSSVMCCKECVAIQ